jgi:hypothetical protein
MRKIRQNTSKNVMLLLVEATSHITGLPGATLTITSSKDGLAFAAITPTVTDLGNGWYSLALTSAHTDTLGDLALHVTATSADPADLVLLIEGGATDADSSLIAKILRNKLISDPTTGIMTLYDDDSVTPYLTAQLYKDAAGTTTYNGTGAERRQRLV